MVEREIEIDRERERENQKCVHHNGNGFFPFSQFLYEILKLILPDYSLETVLNKLGRY